MGGVKGQSLSRKRESAAIKSLFRNELQHPPAGRVGRGSGRGGRVLFASVSRALGNPQWPSPAVQTSDSPGGSVIRVRKLNLCEPETEGSSEELVGEKSRRLGTDPCIEQNAGQQHNVTNFQIHFCVRSP